MFISLITLLACFNAVSTAAPTVNLAEDEFILPPYLMRFDGGSVLNVSSEGKRHGSAANEWLDRMTEFDLPDRMAVQVLMSEKVQWVGGGVLKLRIEQQTWNRPRPAARIFLDRGVAAVWVNGSSEEEGIEVQTPQGSFIAQEATFWMNVKTGSTEIYLLKGSLKDATGKAFTAKKYLNYKEALDSVSSHWDPEAYKVRIAALYPQFIKLVDQADDDFNHEKSKDTYADARKKGWRKKLRK